MVKRRQLANVVSKANPNSTPSPAPSMDAATPESRTEWTLEFAAIDISVAILAPFAKKIMGKIAPAKPM